MCSESASISRATLIPFDYVNLQFTVSQGDVYNQQIVLNINLGHHALKLRNHSVNFRYLSVCYSSTDSMVSCICSASQEQIGSALVQVTTNSFLGQYP